MNAAQRRARDERRPVASAMNAGAPTRAPLPTPPVAATAGHARRTPAPPRWLRVPAGAPLSPRHVLVGAFVLLFPFVATPFITFQIGAAVARARPHRAVAHLPRRLRRHGLAGADDGRRHRRLCASRSSAPAAPPSISLGWPWWVVLPFAIAIATLSATLIGWLSVRTEGIYTIMITLAIGVAFYYLALQNYSVFNGFQGFAESAIRRRCSASTGASRCRSTSSCCSARWPATSWSSTSSARRSASRCRASATTRGA